MLLDLMILDESVEKALEIKKILKLKKGDIIIIELKKEITAGLAMRLEKVLTKGFPDNKSLVLCNGAHLYPLPKKMLNSMGWYERKKLVNKIIK